MISPQRSFHARDLPNGARQEITATSRSIWLRWVCDDRVTRAIYLNVDDFDLLDAALTRIGGPRIAHVATIQKTPGVNLKIFAGLETIVVKLHCHVGGMLHGSFYLEGEEVVALKQAMSHLRNTAAPAASQKEGTP